MIIPAHNLIRHVKGTQHENNVVSSAAFELREDEPSLSVNWIEYFSSREQDATLLCIEEFCLARTVRGTHRFARINVGTTDTELKRSGASRFYFRHSPVEKMDAHSEIEFRDLDAQIAAVCMSELVDVVYNPDGALA